jgi:pantothenate kinase
VTRVAQGEEDAGYARAVGHTVGAPLPPDLLARVRAQLDRQRRVMLGITGPPGAGKSTLAESIVAAFDGAVYLPMDGFHLADVELRRLGRLDRKGAIDTFDGHGYLALLQRIRTQHDEIVYAPAFDRDIEQPIAGGIPIPPGARLVVTEGNYLLDDEPPWPAIRQLLSEVWFIDVPREERLSRLVARHIQFGKSSEQAEAWVREVDERNTERIEKLRHKADLVVTG